jgi:hypothetical protein
MPEEKERPRPHGDPMREEIGTDRNNREENQGQAQSDAAPDAVDTGGREEHGREGGRGSDANGVPAFDEADGDKRKRHYRDGAELVSGID